MRSNYDKEEVEDMNFYDDQKKPNDIDRYLRGGRNSVKREMSEEKGKKLKPEYGDRSGRDNERYTERGEEGSPDDKKLNNQSLPNSRMYSYVQ